VVGLGLMGHGIIQTAAQNGFAVVAVDSEEASIARGMGMIKKSLETIASKSVAKGTATQEAAAKQVALTIDRIQTSTSRGALADCDLVIEAVPETMAIKKPLYTDLAKILRKDAIIASNTSGLPVGKLAEISGRPETTVSCHGCYLGSGARNLMILPCRLACIILTPCN
jgi:3-hydroxybutyryl-CoA dehydrogenase